MLTARGWWFLSAISLVTLLGIVALGWWSATIPLLGMSITIWFVYEWLKFAVEFRSTATRLSIHRTILQSHHEVPAIWAQAAFTVRVTVSASDGIGLPHVVITDEIIANSGFRAETRKAGAISHESPLLLEYSARCEEPGRIRLEGVQIRITDACGFFHRRIVIREPREYLVLPPLVDTRGRPCSRKRYNSLPPPGLHRVRRPGNGSELLDLRDYRPGDPPKLIAWRSSARRDKLITREFESEVPVRSQIFLDASDSACQSRHRSPSVTRFAELAAAIAQTAMSNRDYLGLTIFDDSTSEYLAPARTNSHLIRFTRILAAAAGRFPGMHSTSPEEMIGHAYPVATKYYPELCQSRLNSRPFGLFWQPVADSRMLLVVIALLAWPFLAVQPFILEYLALFVKAVVPHDHQWQTILALITLPSCVAGILCLIHGLRGFLPRRARLLSRRKQLAALYSEQDHGDAGTIELYLNDDVAFVDRTRRFLAMHRVPVWDTNHVLQTDTRPDHDKIQILARTIQAAVSRARDNELYILMVDLTGDDTPMDPLLKAIRMARARHHQVVLLTPSRIPVPPGQPRRRAQQKPFVAIAQAARQKQRERRLQEVRTRFAAAGIPILDMDARDTIASVLEQLDRLRGVRFR